MGREDCTTVVAWMISRKTAPRLKPCGSLSAMLRLGNVVTLRLLAWATRNFERIRGVMKRCAKRDLVATTWAAYQMRSPFISTTKLMLCQSSQLLSKSGSNSLGLVTASASLQPILLSALLFHFSLAPPSCCLCVDDLYLS